jgi:scyllo-inositol 2-dehydrogenase (NADP+)
MSDTPVSELRVGIVGFGRIGAEHAAWIGKAAGLRVAAVADPTPARRELASSRGFKSVEQVEELLGDPAVDVVLISTPTAMHYRQAGAALAAGKHVMVEKPMALDLAESRQLVEQARRAGRVLSVFHNRRWDVDYLTVLQAVRSGIFGKVVNVESRLGQFASCVGPAAKEYRPGWRNEASYGGGGLYDWGSHFVDQIWQLLLPAKPLRVFAQLRGNVWTRDCDDFARVCIDFDDATAAMVEINTTTTAPLPRWHLDGTLGSAQAPHSPEFDTHRWAELDFITADGTRSRVTKAPAGLTATAIWERFATAARGQGEPAVTAESVLTTMALLDAARESARLGMTVPFKSP